MRDPLFGPSGLPVLETRPRQVVGQGHTNQIDSSLREEQRR